MEEMINKLKELVNKTYNSEKCGATEEWSEGNSTDVFRDGCDCGESLFAYQVGMILGMDLKEPEEPHYSWED